MDNVKLIIQFKRAAVGPCIPPVHPHAGPIYFIPFLFATHTHTYSGYMEESYQFFHVRNRSEHCLVIVYTTGTNTLPDDGPVQSETCGSLMFLKTLL